MSAAAWALEIDKDWAEQMGGLRDAVEYVALTGISRIDLRSPVDTGRFRANWTFSIGAPDATVTAKVGSNVAENNAKAQAYPQEGFPVAYLQNNLPYAERLEDGYSSQAPSGMVAITTAELAALWEAQEI
jgi:hypothetical protein